MKSYIICLFFIVSSFLSADQDYQYSRCMISPNNEHNICYIMVPKNASTSLRAFLQVKGRPYSIVKDHINKYIKVVSVRDPLYRPISIYNEIMKLRPDGPWEITEKTEFYKNKDNIELSFKQFLDFITDNFYDYVHITHQHRFLKYKGLTLNDMDYIFLCENLDKDLQKFCIKYNWPYNNYHRNETTTEVKTTLKQYIDSSIEIQNKIKELWKEDFKFYEEAKKYRSKILLTF